MSADTKPAELTETTGEGQGTVTTTTTETQASALEERLAQLEKTHQRVLAESKDWKVKYQSAQEKADQAEREMLTKKEDYKQLLEKERADWQKKEESFTTFKKHTVNKLLEAEIKATAPDVQDVELVKQALPRDLVNAYEEDLEIKFTGVKEGLEKMRKEKPFLFKPTHAPQMTSGKPAVGAKALNGSGKSIHEMTREELTEYYKANAHALK